MYELHSDQPAEIPVGPDPALDCTPHQDAAGPPSMPRSRLSRLLLLALVLSVAMLAGSAVLSGRSDTEHRDAAYRHVSATADLATQRTRSTDSNSSLTAATQASAAFQTAEAAALATAQQATSHIDEQLTVTQKSQAAGLAGNAADYNAAVDRANALVAQEDAAQQQLSDQLDALPAP